MKIIYIVYREDNTLIFESQVLKYLNLAKKEHYVDLMLFRNHETFFKKKEVEEKISKYLTKFITLPSLPPLFEFQLKVDALRLKHRVEKSYKKDEAIFIMCRGELSTYIAKKAFKNFENVHILYDNRGLPIEELEMRNKSNLIYKLNKRVKGRAISFSKENCNAYSFVTNNLRNYLISDYDYSRDKEYFIIPTLADKEKLDQGVLNKIKNEINYDNNNFYVTYIGSVAAWQSITKIFDVYLKVREKIKEAKLLILTNGEVNFPENITKEIQESIIIKSVKHDFVKYYLEISNLGLVIRNNNIVNKVAAPTKISEYITYGVPLLYSGKIGILEDLENTHDRNHFIDISKNDWLEKVECINSERNKKESNFDETFSMKKQQKYLLNKIEKLFK
ncbi:hypothetical protein PM10SUCC1_24290 [Propionigenium maris DSM 9537]|uniref:Uncharacterized protein n=1 Tax=Propionigenium maris DSM 9537 TaxID=1123000 RepID=A0A9W6LPG7_9FUSO|nr:hypothetical protein [Propionigenium maris]GLI56915.1 hypothetical protein PM10SUCC1_24290 [Propionigenium maris DSM 9537]